MVGRRDAFGLFGWSERSADGRGIGTGWLIGEDGKVGREEGKVGKEEGKVGKEEGKGDVCHDYCLNQSVHDTTRHDTTRIPAPDTTTER